MNRNSFTEGAQRALRLAATIAERDASEVHPSHLLSALLSEESRANEIIAQFGMNEVFDDTFDVVQAAKETAISVDFKSSFNPNQLSLGIAVQEIVGSARRLTTSGAEPTEIGTEHLLWGLTSVESPEAKLLAQHGIDAESLGQLISDGVISVGEPIEVDFAISYTTVEKETHVADDPKTKERTCDDIDVLRVVDAAANRAREGMRVVEDYVRFILDDGFLVEELKRCRHELSARLQQIETRRLLTARDTVEDVGTSISTKAERTRESTDEVVTASFKRAQEAVRTLEEYSKLITPDAASTFEKLRYRLYTIEKSVMLTDSNCQRLRDCDLYFLLTESNCVNELEQTVVDALAAGVNVIQLREKQKCDRDIVKLGKRLRQWTREANALFTMNDRPDLAVTVDADGVHVGQEELSVRDARRIVGTDRLVGVSTHSIDQARQAVIDGANYIGVGPVFPSSTKSFQEFAGLDFVRQVASEIRLPWFAIGGIAESNVDEVLAAGATRIAVSGAICKSDDTNTATQTLKSRLRVSSNI